LYTKKNLSNFEGLFIGYKKSDIILVALVLQISIIFESDFMEIFQSL